MTVVCNALGRCAGHSISLLTFDRLPFFKPFQTTRQRRNLNPTAVPAFNSAAYWRGNKQSFPFKQKIFFDRTTFGRCL